MANHDNEELFTITPDSKFDMNRVVFRDYKKDARGGGVVRIYVLDDNGREQPLIMETPYMRAFTGVCKSNDDRPKYSLPVSLDGYDEEGDVKEFHTFMQNLHEKMVDTVHKNVKAWLPNKKGKKRDIINEFGRLSIKKKDDYPPTFNMKLSSNKAGEITTVVYKNRSSLLGGPEEAIVQNSKVKALAECANMWIIDDKYSMPWEVHQCRVKNPVSKTKYSFKNVSDDDEDDDDVEPAANNGEDEHSGAVEEDFVSDEEEDELNP